MSQSEEQKKAAVTKGLAVVGLVTAILLLVWLAVQIASLVPSAFGSLASLADSVYNHDSSTTLNVGTERKVVNSGDVFTVNWEAANTAGSYSFEYECVSGVSLTVRPETGQVIDLLCDTVFPLQASTDLELIVRTEQTRFADIAYTIAFVPDADAGQSVAETAVITVVNPSIPAGTTIDTDSATDAASEETPAETPTTEEDASQPDTTTDMTTEETPVTSADTAADTRPPTANPGPQYVETVTYSIPVSDPNGYVDLKVNYRGVGIVSNDRFVSRREIKDNQSGAIAFTIENIGSKTSDDWEFEATLPTGATYESGTQAPLKTGEIASFILQFEGIDDTGVKPIGVAVTTATDRNRNNNSFTWSVRVVD